MDADRPGFEEEQALLAALRHRRPEACEAFVDAHYGEVYRLLLWLCGETETASDVRRFSAGDAVVLAWGLRDARISHD